MLFKIRFYQEKQPLLLYLWLKKCKLVSVSILIDCILVH